MNNENLSKLESVELVPAFSYCCDACGRENFTRAVALEMDGQTLQNLRADQDLLPEESGQFPDRPASQETGLFLMNPGVVQCAHCRTRFATVDYNSQE